MTLMRKSTLSIVLMLATLVPWVNQACATGPSHVEGHGWDASTRVINSYLTDSDIQKVLNLALTPAFMQAFPVSRFGLFVLVDKSQSRELTQEVVYLLLSLCKRRQDGSYELPIATYSIVVPMNLQNVTDGDPERRERTFIAERLLQEARSFSLTMVQNAARFR